MPSEKGSTRPETAQLLLAAARYLGETLDPQRVYERFRELLADAIPHDGVVVSSYDAATRTIVCDYAWVDGELLDVAIFPPLQLNEQGGMQSQVIRSGEPLLVGDVKTRVQDPGTYYDVDGEGNVRKVPDEGAPQAESMMMVPVKHEGNVVGVVQLTSDHVAYDEGQLELVEGMVAQLAASVRNARLHGERLRAEAATAAAEAVAAERERAAMLLEAVGDGIVFVGDDGIGFWNAAAATISGLREQDVRGKQLAELPGGWGVVPGAVAPTAQGEVPVALTLPIESAGRELWLSFVAVQTPEGVVYAFRDLTPQHQLEQQKHDFIATVSHELRTPMTGVLGAAQTLLRDDLDLSPETRRELLQMIAAQAERLADVTETILLAGRLDRDEVTLESALVDVDAVVRDIVSALASTMPDSVRLEVDLDAPAALADASRLQQVVVNLLDNAAKYSADGGVVSLRTFGHDHRVHIEVTDRGSGIAADEHEQIFDKFYRSDANRKLAPSGTGLGLYISRELVERMGGRIRLVSAPGKGSTFTVELPAA